MFLLVVQWRAAVNNEENSDPGLYLMYRPMLEIFSYLGGLPGLLAVKSESHRNGASFGGAVAFVAMAVESANLAEIFSSDSTVLGLGRSNGGAVTDV